jgi:cytochrome P450
MIGRLAHASPLELEDELRSATYFEDPYRVYGRLRRECPVYWSESWNGWLVSTYADVKKVLEQPTLFSSADRVRPRMQNLPADVWATMERVYGGFQGFFWSDPPEYTRHRAMVNKTFRPRIVDLAPRLVELVDSAIDAKADAGSMDVIADLAHPLPATVVFEILGIPPEDRELFRGWTTDMIKLAKLVDRETVSDAIAGMDAACGWMRDLLLERRQHPQDDMLSVFAGKTGLAELPETAFRTTVVTVIQFLLAGHETTTNLIGNGLLALLERPECVRRLLDDPSAVEPAIEEMLRFDSPLQYLTRRATASIEGGGESISDDEMVIPILGSANRDGRQFPDPDRFDLDRRPNRHLAFGFNIHFCLGAPLARLEAQIVFSRLLVRLRGLRLDGDPVWRSNPMFRGLESLPVVFDEVQPWGSSLEALTQ